MSNGGEAADQMVSYALKSGEVVLRLSGEGAKNLAAYLMSLLKNKQPGRGAIKLKRMLAEGRELSVQRISIDEIKDFKAEAKKYGVEFCILKNTNLGDGRCDILFKTEDAQRVNRIYDNLEITRHPETAHITSEIIRNRDEKEVTASENPRTARIPERPSPVSGRPSRDSRTSREERPSVREALNAIRANKEAAPKIPGRGVTKGRTAR